MQAATTPSRINLLMGQGVAGMVGCTLLVLLWYGDLATAVPYAPYQQQQGMRNRSTAVLDGTEGLRQMNGIWRYVMNGYVIPHGSISSLCDARSSTPQKDLIV